ncbi:hypothetical protein [Corallococcus sp. 4LFB]|uniref:hypothetical protein n=1 Tax=Corallococcus sp. 4LFB TaxID=3383249 RepID=UPI0039764BDA
MTLNHFARKLLLAAPLSLFAVGCGGDPMMDEALTNEAAPAEAAAETAAPEDASLATSEQGVAWAGPTGGAPPPTA